MKVLLIGDNLRACLAVSIALDYHKIQVDVLGHWNLRMERFKSINQYFNFSLLQQGLKHYYKEFDQLLNNNYDAVIPITDEGMEIASYFKNLIEKKSKIIGLPEADKWTIAKNKYATIELFSKLNFKTPKTTVFSSIEELDNSDYKYDFPYILKPQSSKKTVGDKILSSSTFFIKNFKDFNTWKRNNLIFPILKQEIVNGEEFGFNFYAEDGKVLNFYIDKHLYGIPGFESTSRRLVIPSEDEYNKIVECFKIVVKEICWTGVGMFDFKWFNNNIYIIEFNPRFWASIYMDIKAQSNILNSWIARQLLNQNVRIKPVEINSKLVIHNWNNELKLSIYFLKNKKFMCFIRWVISLHSIFKKGHFFEKNI